MDKWLTVPPDLEPFIGSALALYSLYRQKKALLQLACERAEKVLDRMCGVENGAQITGPDVVGAPATVILL
jgi:hypothetical protein